MLSATVALPEHLTSRTVCPDYERIEWTYLHLAGFWWRLYHNSAKIVERSLYHNSAKIVSRTKKKSEVDCFHIPILCNHDLRSPEFHNL
mmetsp:Transcript_13243/g.21569  ORF Transcript_13243/g.21569 Transcript_13243/m.21569 type:complete len:89 (+) Transcript_13243:487-753(+)